LKKAILFLPGFLVLAGCGGYQYRVQQQFLAPPPSLILEDISLPDLPRLEPSPDVPSLLPPAILPRTVEDSTRIVEEEGRFCHLPAPLVLTEAEDFIPPSWSGLSEDSRPEGNFKRMEPGLSTPGHAIGLEKGVGEKRPEGFSSLAMMGLSPSGKKTGPPGLASPLIRETAEFQFPPPTGEGVGVLGPVPSSPLEAGEGLLPLLPQETSDGERPRALAPGSMMLGGIPALLNERVKTFIDLFQNKADRFFSKSLARSQAYEGMMKQIFREKNLPEELFYLALIESGYNPRAQSRAKALGIWQFMSKTAKRFGLKVDKWVDERRDPEKSTQAAAEYLKSLYEMFNCWYLATASYNAGEGKILQAMKKAKSQDFWEISNHRYLKRETKEYVPMFLAAMIIARDPQKYGFSNIEYHPPLRYEKVAVPPGTRLTLIARAAETEIENIRALNPSLQKDQTPPDGSPFEIRVPAGRKEVFEANFSRMKLFDPRTARKHQVSRGETLGQIAKKYRVDLQELCEGNQITAKTPIRPGMILLLPPK